MIKKTTLLLLCFSLTGLYSAFAQKANFVSHNIFQTDCFIENNGQFDAWNSPGKPVLFGVLNASDHFYFHKSGFAYHIAKWVGIDNSAKDPDEVMGTKMEGDINMQWIGSNPNVQVLTEYKTGHYFTFGEKALNSYGYKKITYQNMYPGIDIVYVVNFTGGVKYSLILHPGADLSQVKYTYTGKDVKIRQTEMGVQIDNDLEPMIELNPKTTDANGTVLHCAFTLNKNIISYTGLTHISNTTTIDPWIGSITSLTNGSTATGRNKGYDVDYDNDGNLYVFGGGGYGGISNNQMIAKYTSKGKLLWTFSGSIISIPWVAEPSGYASNFITDKANGKVYTGQGFAPSGGAVVVRLDSSGNYDKFKSTQVDSFKEIWEMNFNCHTGAVICMGGSTGSSSLNIGLIDKITAVYTPQNLTGIRKSGYQDILSSVFDPNGNLYVILASAGGTVFVNNRIYMVNSALNGHIWDTVFAPKTFQEANNKVYGTPSNGFNALGASNKYLFCYDGVHIQAYNLKNGSPVGKMDTINGFLDRRQGGIVADQCGHIFVGGDSSRIKVFKFDSAKGYTPLPDIHLDSSGVKHVYDLHYFSATGTIFVSGDSLVAEVTSPYSCSDSTSKVVLFNNCNIFSARITNPDSVSTYTFKWVDSAKAKVVRQITLEKKNIADTLKDTANDVYFLTIIKNAECGGGSQHFTFACYNISVTVNDTFCQGSYYVFGQDTLTSPGMYVNTFLSKKGRDSIVTLKLGQWKTTSSILDTFVAYGDSFLFNKKYYQLRGLYSDTLKGKKGCDSVAFLNLIVKGGDVLVPSAFVPGQKGTYGRLVPIPIRHAIVDRFCIFDRWGELIYSSEGDGNKGFSGGWDGTYMGQPMPIDNYVYYLTYHDNLGNHHVIKGSVTLLR